MANAVGLLLLRGWEKLKSLFKDESGMATLEMVLLVCVLIALALMFKDTIIDFVSNVLDSIAGQGNAFDPASIVP